MLFFIIHHPSCHKEQLQKKPTKSDATFTKPSQFYTKQLPQCVQEIIQYGNKKLKLSIALEKANLAFQLIFPGEKNISQSKFQCAWQF